MAPAARIVLCLVLLYCCVLGGCGGHSSALSDSIDRSAVPISYGVGGGREGVFALEAGDWERMLRRFRPFAPDPHSERERIAEAVADFERIAARTTPTGGDLAFNRGSSTPGGQLDCIDEARNTTTYMLTLQQAGLLRWHRVQTAVTRVHGPLIHSAACIEEVLPPGARVARFALPGRRWAVDSWYGASGEPPMIQPLERWFEGRLEPLGQPTPPWTLIPGVSSPTPAPAAAPSPAHPALLTPTGPSAPPGSRGMTPGRPVPTGEPTRPPS